VNKQFEDYLKNNPVLILAQEDEIDSTEFNFMGKAKSTEDLKIDPEEARIALLKYQKSYENTKKLIEFLKGNVIKPKNPRKSGFCYLELRNKFLEANPIDPHRNVIPNIDNCIGVVYDILVSLNSRNIINNIVRINFRGFSLNQSFFMGEVLHFAINTYEIAFDSDLFTTLLVEDVDGNFNQSTRTACGTILDKYQTLDQQEVQDQEQNTIEKELFKDIPVEPKPKPVAALKGNSKNKYKWAGTYTDKILSQDSYNMVMNPDGTITTIKDPFKKSSKTISQLKGELMKKTFNDAKSKMKSDGNKPPKKSIKKGKGNISF